MIKIKIILSEEEEDWLFEIIFTAQEFQDPWEIEAYNLICGKLRENRRKNSLIIELNEKEIDAMEERLKEDLNLYYFEYYKKDECNKEEFEGSQALSNSILKKITRPIWTEKKASKNY